jgi:cytosine/adenosine deaminase-related metal-dependent hydrolase/C-terminal processing protease CtpA/Prc
MPGKYVLQGRLVTMGPDGIIDDGAVFVDGNRIKHVRAASDPIPPEFGGAVWIDTKDTIYPGLVELHNHLCYNAMPLWYDPPRKYTNNGQWRGSDEYKRRIAKPAQILGRDAAAMPALVRFTECRCLLGGTTTSQGITLYDSKEGMKQCFQGIVRNVEKPLHPDLESAGARVANPDTNDQVDYLAKLTAEKCKCYLQHLSEGIDDTARGWFHRLKFPGVPERWALAESFCGIHCNALEPEDFAVIKGYGGSVVWSPLSNYMLYGETMDIKAAKESEVLIGIGCDWAPSGSKNLLGELKVAWVANREYEEEYGETVFTLEDLVAMATRNGAEILGWDSLLGTIAPDKLADLLVIDGQDADSYMHLIKATESDVRLVTIDGTPRFGQKSYMNRFGFPPSELEDVRIGADKRQLYLTQDNPPQWMGGLTLEAATEELRDALLHIEDRAEAVENAYNAGLFGGALDAGGVYWRMIDDFGETDVKEFNLAEGKYTEWVEGPMRLEPITFVDDDQFLGKLYHCNSIPTRVRNGLFTIHGETPPLPDDAKFLGDDPAAVAPELRKTTRSLRSALERAGGLTPHERKRIVDQAIVLLEQNYVHLPFKRARHAVDPVQRLRLLRHRLEDESEEDRTPEIEFHNEITRAFGSLKDLHTSYRLPRPFRYLTAWLPFLIEEFWDKDIRKYVVSKVVAGAGPRAGAAAGTFVPGVEPLYWNGVPIERAIALNGERQGGCNEAARHARGLDALTIRPLASGLPPDEEWVTLTYRDRSGEVREWTQPWLAFERGVDPDSLNPERMIETGLAVGLDAATYDIHRVKTTLFAYDLLQKTRDREEAGCLDPIPGRKGEIETVFPTNFRAAPLQGAEEKYGYVRIFSFGTDEPATFVKEFARLVQNELPEEGLVIDVRGNPGGNIVAAERLLQSLTSRRIQPQKAQFIISGLNYWLSKGHETLKPWTPSLWESLTTGATYSLAYPITPPGDLEEAERSWDGPVVLITDALCYSATDIFAAGFADHNIGRIIGIHDTTGAGGANVWSHRLIRWLLDSVDDPEAPSPYARLPRGCDMRVSMRRTMRVGPKEGVLVEDYGVAPDEVYRMRKEKDVLGANEGLMRFAGEVLSKLERYDIEVTFDEGEGYLPAAVVRSRNVARLDVMMDDRTLISYDTTGDEIRINLDEVVRDLPLGKGVLAFRGYDVGGNEVAVRRAYVPVASVKAY